MLLTELAKLSGLEFTTLSDNSNIFPENITLNSKETDNKTIFTAIKGFKTDGHLFIKNAYNNGTRNFIIEDMSFIDKTIISDSSIIIVTDSRTAMAYISRTLYKEPDTLLNITGVTGSKGKTTVTTLLFKILNTLNNTSFFTTIKYKAGCETGDSERTTMESDRLQKLLRKTVDDGDKNGIIEVSSHAVTLKRVAGIMWDSGIFTSFSRDHLDLYGTMENYFEAKLDFFRALNASSKKNKFAVINIDDPKGNDVCRICDESIKLYRVSSTDKTAEFYIKSYKDNETGMDIQLSIDGNEPVVLHTGLRGTFNVTNAVLATAAAMARGISFDTINGVLSGITGVDGRFDIVISSPFTVIVDYAHTPESLNRILIEGRKICKGKLISVFGCTGDRDKEKRSIMGEVSFDNADFTIITDDDIYTEPPEEIIKMIVAGFESKNAKINSDYIIERDRKTAIKKALDRASKGDVIVLAGMGHEKFQITNEGKVPHSDRETVMLLKKNYIDQ